MSRSSVVMLLVVVVAAMAFVVTAFSPDDEPRPVPAATSTAASGDGGDPVAQGEALARAMGCIGCHTIDGKPGAGPTWKGLAGSEVELTDGTTVVADTDFLKESIVDPDKQIVKGYTAGVMTPSVQANLARIQEGNNLDALVAYIESLK